MLGEWGEECKEKSWVGKFPAAESGLGGLRLHGKRDVLPQAAEDLPGPAAGHRGLRDDVRRDGVLWDPQTAEENRGDGPEVSAAPGVSLGSAPR